MHRAVLAALLLFSLCAGAQQTGPVEITAEPHHDQVIDNLFVRVFAVTVEPKTTTLMHHHGQDYIAIALGDSEIMNVRPGAQPVAVKFKDGDVRYTPAGLVHAVANETGSAFHNVTIELKQPTTNQKNCTEACAIPVPCDAADKAACTSVTKIMTSDQWSVTEVVMPPGAKYPRHTHLANFLLIPLTNGDLRVSVQDGPEQPAHDRAGKVAWHNPVIHAINNAGSNTVKAVVLEFRGRPAGEGSESMGPQDKKSGEHKPHDHQ